ncbi:hypothetical protein J2X48_000723 [Bosea sp. BE271]|uniref:hypothetical protein n=1 Tax=Bosea TaxID=85413 RepID=UPI00285A0B64|nr:MULTISPECIES: hypothetical protein [Bosea]MDR6826473.1 hypothetical protein [Bosea robiniae]MDR6893183.1 hypothetical protein [Bosea sp. BE109]MDR7137118.1 hypothetical protein [Bosea sp. BE168]MDR7173817.1 hypothetical protein [Bosea sp. BE271]
MNAETRAKEIVQELCKPLDGGRPFLETPHRKLMAEIIATAIRQAENDKLEEAADAATKFLVGDPFNGVPLRSPGPHEIAAHIRSLKLKD